MTTKQIRLLVLDVDGTLTDGKVYMGANGEAVKAFDIKDGYGIANILPRLGIIPVIITGRKSEILVRRCEELKITHIYQGIIDKVAKLNEVLAELGISAEEVAYVGDDLNDLACMQMCGWKACPVNAVAKVKAEADFIATHEGGAGAVRDVIDYLEKLQSPLMKKAFAYLESIKGQNLEVGHYELESIRLYANVDAYATRPYADTRFESHRKYIDIQYMISGEEEIEVTDIHNLAVSEHYDYNRDVMFYNGHEAGKRYKLTDGKFVIFFPEDAHRPCIAVGDEPKDVKKMVIKILLEE